MTGTIEIQWQETIEMRPYDHRYRLILTFAIFVLFICVLSGCAMVGPSSISAGRGDYNEAINRTEDEQLLLSIVKGRYGEMSSMLSVTGVAANIRFRANAGVQAGFGPTNNYLGNLVPFTGGLAYEENPTITYSPIRGEIYLRQVMTPIPLDLFLLAIRSMESGGGLFVLLVDRINDLRNPDFVDSSAALSDSRFMRFVELFRVLHGAGVLELLGDPKKEIVFNMVIGNYAPRYTKKVTEILTLLDLPVPTDGRRDIIIPAYFTVRAGRLEGIAITTRSTLDLIEIMRASIEVPEAHARAGLTIDFRPVGLAGQGLRIISSEEKPQYTSLAVKYRGYWFYIYEADQKTKGFFRILRTFWSVCMATAEDRSDAPILTIPVGR